MDVAKVNLMNFGYLRSTQIHLTIAMNIERRRVNYSQVMR